jgi:hypothetical protein
MASVTLQMLKGYLERFGWSRYQAVDEPFEQEGLIHTGWRSSEADEGYTMTIDPMVERNCLSFKVVRILSAPLDSTPRERLSDLWLAMSYINYRIILGKFAYDPSDGEVRFSVNVPIDQNTFTYEQFTHTMGVVIKTVERYAPILRRIVAGELSAEQFIAEDRGHEMRQIREAFGELLRGLLEALERESGDSDTPKRRDGEDDLTEV